MHTDNSPHYPAWRKAIQALLPMDAIQAGKDPRRHICFADVARMDYGLREADVPFAAREALMFAPDALHVLWEAIIPARRYRNFSQFQVAVTGTPYRVAVMRFETPAVVTRLVLGKPICEEGTLWGIGTCLLHTLSPNAVGQAMLKTHLKLLTRALAFTGRGVLFTNPHHAELFQASLSHWSDFKYEVK